MNKKQQSELNMKTLSLLILLLSGLSQANDETPSNPVKKPGLPQGFIYGAGVSYQQQIYKGFDQRTIALPLLGYVGEKFNIFGPFISYSLMRKNDWNLELNLSPRFSGYDDSDSDFFIGMHERKDSLDAGFTLKYNPNQWSFQFKALTDTLSKSNGSEFELNIDRKFKYKFLTFQPAIAIQHFDNNLSNYYYGVKQDEVTALRPFYKGSSTINQSLKLSVYSPIPIGLVRLDLTNTWFGSEITDSPLVDSSQALGARLFFIAYF
jgi:outer membrane protein